MTAPQIKVYQAFGLTIHSEVILDELRPHQLDAAADVTIKYVSFGRELPSLETGVFFNYESDRGVEMVWPDVAAFRVIGDNIIEVEPYPNTPPHFLAFPILGPVFAWILYKRGYFVLHASGLNIDGHCISFLGDKLAGKSTTAAAFLRRGGKLVTDDLLALQLDTAGLPIVQPAFAQVKLADDAASMISIEGSEALPLVVEGFLKRQHRLDKMYTDPIVLDRVFVLERGAETPSIEWLDPGAGLKALLRFSYASRFADAPEDRGQRALEFQQCAGIISKSRIGILHVPASLSSLDGVVDFVLADLALGR
jgi:hypothetical protein